MSEAAELRQRVDALPKVELHVHLEGSIEPATLLELARRRGVELPADGEEGLRKWFEFRDFEHFVEIYLTCCRCLRDPEDFQLVMDQFLAQQARQQVLYSEVHFTIGTHLANGANGDEVAAALDETLSAAPRRHGVWARLIPDIVRNVEPVWADRTLEWALEGRDRGVVALGLSGFESSPDEPFREHFRVARQEGLGTVAHAGEHGGPESIRSVLEVVHPQRLGHGIRAIDDPSLVEQLAEQRLPLEICPSSNVCLGAVRSIEEHPFSRLESAGVVVTVNSDDPPLFGTNLTEELVTVAETFDYSIGDLVRFLRNALDRAFIDGREGRALMSEFDRRLLVLNGVQSTSVDPIVARESSE